MELNPELGRKERIGRNILTGGSGQLYVLNPAQIVNIFYKNIF
jgi:hypothetical protein